MKSNRHHADQDEAEIEQDAHVEAVIVGQDSFETRFYGKVDFTVIAYPGQTDVRSGMILVHRLVPEGMAMTEWRTQIMGAYPVCLPVRLH